MFDSITKLIIGDLDDKRAYKQMMKRVESLPKDFRFAFKKIQKYMYTVGAPNGDMTMFMDLNMFSDLIDLFESSAAEGRTIIDVIGSDIGKFSDDFMCAYITDKESLREKLNKEILEKLNKGEE